MTAHPFRRHLRLDFEGSPDIPEVGADFDPAAFATALKEAHVDGVTLAAKDCHGLATYPTAIGRTNPALGGRDLLGEQVQALSEAGIAVRVSLPVAWEAAIAEAHREWRQMDRAGCFVRSGAGEPGGFWYLNPLHGEYQERILAELEEIATRYEIAGFLLGCVYFGDDCCWSAASRAFREKQGFVGTDAETAARFPAAATRAFARKIARAVAGLRGEPAFWMEHDERSYTDSRTSQTALFEHLAGLDLTGGPERMPDRRHLEASARQASAAGIAFGATVAGRNLQRETSLEYGAFRAQALGGGPVARAHLHPRGALDAAMMRTVQKVYRQVEKVEPVYADTRPWVTAAVMHPGWPGRDSDAFGQSLEGALRLMRELHVSAVVVDDRSRLDDFELVLLPDSVVVTPFLARKLKKFHQGGGKLLVSYRSGFSADGEWSLDFLPVRHEPDPPFGAVPAYWRLDPEVAPEFVEQYRLIECPGACIRPEGDAQAWIARYRPYFRRDDLRFCGEGPAPVDPQGCDATPATISGTGCMVFAEPIFREYGLRANPVVRDVVEIALRRLVGNASFGEGLPATIEIYPLRRGDDLLLTLLHYIPQRKGDEEDVVNEPLSFHGLQLRLNRKVKDVRVLPSGATLQRGRGGAVQLPAVRGRAILEAVGYFG